VPVASWARVLTRAIWGSAERLSRLMLGIRRLTLSAPARSLVASGILTTAEFRVVLGLPLTQLALFARSVARNGAHA
jgi:hypothetical protein